MLQASEQTLTFVRGLWVLVSHVSLGVPTYLDVMGNG